MIDPDEIDAKGEEFQLNVANVERDYIFGWILAILYGESPLADVLTLKGGNAFRKALFPDSRFSEDLDFSCSGSLGQFDLVEEFNKICRSVEAHTGVSFDIDRNRLVNTHSIDEDRTVHKLRLYFSDFAQDTDSIVISIRLDVTEFDQLRMSPTSRRLIHPYSDSDHCAVDLRVVAPEEAIADKLKCLIQRRSCFDVFDAMHGITLGQEREVDLFTTVQVFLEKTIFRPAPGAALGLLTSLPLGTLEPYWEKVVCPAASRLPFDAAIDRLSNALRSIFAPFDFGTHLEGIFFPAELRNPILDAGLRQTVLRIRYQGYERLVEPYSLVFKRRKDGVAREYFYVFDLSGGKSRPGIKSMIAQRLEILETTEVKFEPRFEIELSRAGGQGTQGYFAGRHRMIRFGRKLPRPPALPRIRSV